jgi:glycosyltransferase involved in cell wall biosynthesis
VGGRRLKREARELRVANVLEEGRFGGPHRRILSVARVLRDDGVDTVVVAPTRDSAVLRDRAAESGVRVRTLDLTRLTLHTPTLLRYLLRFPLEVVALARLLREEGVDLVHVNGAYQFKAALAARLSGVPVVWHLNDTMMPRPVRWAFRATSRFCADAFIVAGERVRAYYLEPGIAGTRPVTEIHAPVDMARFAPADPADAGPEDGPLVGMVAHLNPTKGVEYFVEAAAEVAARHPDVRFEIAGAELDSHRAYAAGLRGRAEELGLTPDRLRFVGAVRDVPGFLSRCDVCVFTSIAEASPTAVWEAMASGRPVVTTDVGSVSQHIRSGESGFVVPVGDVSGLASCVSTLIRDPELCREIGLRARRHAERELSLDSAATAHRQFYERVAASPRR